MARTRVICGLCGATSTRARASAAGWRIPTLSGNGYIADGPADPSLVRCRLCALGLALVGAEASVDGDAAYEAAMSHLRQTLIRKEWQS